MKEKYITITGFDNYYGKRPFGIGSIVLCEKRPENTYDSEAIACIKPFLGLAGYVANSPHTVADGTMSAGRIYDKVGNKFYACVMFATGSKIICRVVDDPAEAEAELLAQKEKFVEEPREEENILGFTELVF